MKEFFCDSWSQLIETIKEAKSELGNPSVLWYRGQGDAAYKLTPSLVRQTNGLAKEKEVFDFF